MNQVAASFDPKKVAREVLGFCQDAVGDMASDMLSPSSGFLDDKWKKKIAKMKKAGCSDVLDSVADELYNDSDTLRDLLGDKIYEACCKAYSGDLAAQDKAYNSVLDVLEERAFPGLKKACKELRRK